MELMITFVTINYYKNKQQVSMAKPIKETPILKGKDARVFMSKMASPTKGKAIDEKTRQRMRDNFNKLNAIVKS